MSSSLAPTRLRPFQPVGLEPHSLDFRKRTKPIEMFRGSGRTQESCAEVLAVGDVDFKLRPASSAAGLLSGAGASATRARSTTSSPPSEVAGDGYTLELGLRPFECFLRILQQAGGAVHVQPSRPVPRDHKNCLILACSAAPAPSPS
jgi:hypothetical protein